MPTYKQTQSGTIVSVTKTFLYSDWQPSASGNYAIPFGTIPAKAIPVATSMVTITGFNKVGGTITAATIRIEDHNNSPVCVAFPCLTANQGGNGGNSNSQVPVPQAGTNNVYARLTLSEGMPPGVINDLTSGEVEITIWYLLP